jgi:hypothetical protein
VLAAAADRGGRLITRIGPGRALLIARFIPVVRTVIAPLCGSAGVEAGRFTRWQAAGGAIWSVGTTMTGYLAVRAVPGLTRYLLPAMVGGLAVSTLVTLVHARRARRALRGSRRSGHHAHGRRAIRLAPDLEPLGDPVLQVRHVTHDPHDPPAVAQVVDHAENLVQCVRVQ